MPQVMNRTKITRLSQARKIIAYISCRRYRIPVKLVANFFGITSSSVSNMLETGKLLTIEAKL